MQRRGGGGGGREGGYRLGPGGNCVCPNCGHKKEHLAGVPCYDEKCPKCGTLMARESGGPEDPRTNG